jgi:hypothetical protein
MQPEMETIGILLVLLGLGAGTYGAYVIYRADFPRNDWIVDALYNAASKPSYGVIAPNGYSPSAEREQGLERAREVMQQGQNFAKTSRKGMMAIGIGFVLQVIGNLFLLWPLVCK